MGPGLVIAIDGPAGSGKSSVSRAVATRLGLNYLDTGAMYRAITWAVLEAGIDPDDADAVAGFIEDPSMPSVVSGVDPANPTIAVGGVDVADPIRTARVTDAVSAVSAVPSVRSHLVERQRRYVADSAPGIVVEGRDIGSVVLPDADLKVFLTAEPSVRAQRRAAERLDGHAPSIDATESALITRDARDSTRAVSPLARAYDAIEVDTSAMTFDAVVDAVVQLAEQAVKT
jgi:cytidylate kinase